MAKFGTFRYGEEKYGVETTENLLWALEIDWNGKGFTGANEAGRMTDCKITRGRNYLLNSSGTGFQRMQPGRAAFTLDDQERRYDPYNESSPLYPHVLPGKRFRLRVKNGTSGELRYVMSGFIEDIQPVSGRDQVYITGVDALELFANQDISTSAVEESIRIDDAVETALLAAGWADYEIDQQSDIIRYWWVDNERLISAIGELEDISLGTFFMAADGVAKYYSRTRTLVEVLALESGDILREIKLSQPWETVRNAIEMIVNPRVLQADSELWALKSQPSVPDGGSIEIWAPYRFGEAAVPAIDVHVPSTDFAVKSSADGSGADLTGDCAVTLTAFPETAKLVISNASGQDGYITSLKVFGKAISMPNPVIVRDSNPDSIAIYDTRRLRIDSTWLQDTNVAIDLAAALVDLLSEARKNPTVRLDGRPDIQFIPDLCDRVSLDVPTLAINYAYRVGAIEHDWVTSNGQRVVTTLRLEPIIDTSNVYWTFPTEIGITSVFGF